MRPNGRTLHKVLMKHRNTTFWGSRAFITVRLPTSVLPVPMPSRDYASGWGKEELCGMWTNELPDGTLEHRSISRLYSGCNPLNVDVTRDTPVHFLGEDIHPDGFVGYSWWEGIFQVFRGEEPLEEADLPVEDVAAHRDLQIWCGQYLIGSRPAERGTVIEAFLRASNAAKTHYTNFSDDGKYLYFTYSVKLYYPAETRKFCSSLKRAFRVASESGIDAKLIR